MLTASFLAIVSATADQIFLKLDGVPGDSRVEGHADEIDVLGCSIGTVKATNAPAPRWSSVTLAKRMDRASLLFAKSLCQGTVHPKALLTMRDPTGTDYYSIEMTQVRTVSWNTGQNSQSQHEDVGLSFATITIKYLVLQADGTPAGQAGMTWDLLKNAGGTLSTNYLLATLSAHQGSTSGVLTWNANPNKTYQVLASSNPSGPFQTNSTVLSGTNTSLSIPVQLNSGQLFFRIKEL